MNEEIKNIQKTNNTIVQELKKYNLPAISFEYDLKFLWTPEFQYLIAHCETPEEIKNIENDIIRKCKSGLNFTSLFREMYIKKESITEKQILYLDNLLKKSNNNLKINDVSKLSKFVAAMAISFLKTAPPSDEEKLKRFQKEITTRLSNALANNTMLRKMITDNESLVLFNKIESLYKEVKSIYIKNK